MLLPKHLLPLIPAGLLIQQVLPAEDRLTIVTEPSPRSSACPTCQEPSRRPHSRYTRSLGDLPWQGRPVTVQVTARRFRCANRSCPRRTFAERLSGIAPPAARRTGRLRDLQRQLGLALGGEAGSRLAQRLAMPTSPDTLLRLVGAAGTGVVAPAPRVLGVDDWAWRRGHRYGTILVDLERNKVIDLLPDRQAETLAAWLRRNPGVEIVARDRAGAYADGVRQGAPEAVQVADRWHLLRNLGEAVRAVVDRHHADARQAARQVIQDLAVAAHAAAMAVEKRPSAAELRLRDAYARRQARYEEAARLRQGGMSLRRVAALLGVERKTVRGWLRAGHAPLWTKPPRGSVLDPYRDHLERRWAEGCCNAAQLWRELVERGFAGRPSVVRAWAGRRRQAEPDRAGRSMTAAGLAWRPPSSHRVARLLMTAAEVLPATDRAFVARLLGDAPELGRAIAAAKQLRRVLRREGNEDLEGALAAAEGTPLASFATGLRQDLRAVRAALELPWTTSPVEGQISRLKMLKRTMYGRAGFPLLRQRVLHAA